MRLNMVAERIAFCPPSQHYVYFAAFQAIRIFNSSHNWTPASLLLGNEGPGRVAGPSSQSCRTLPDSARPGVSLFPPDERAILTFYGMPQRGRSVHSRIGRAFPEHKIHDCRSSFAPKAV